MLELKGITKNYTVAGGTVHALKDVSINFRRNEFVSILGPSGCGKTTLLNIIGGLDHYTSGDLIIEGTSTKEYSDRDWDTYRNHSIGFVFQSYHLIPHQTVLQNVELALMISGVSKKERRKRAIEALEKVGLKDRMHNKPNQLSGGQAQRVAIARALINNPEIVLADEPTGALDSKTSVQIMDLLKEISKDRLVIIVTHNPELAEQYSTRIVNLLDGEIIGDSMPYDGGEEGPEPSEEEREQLRRQKGSKKLASMSLGMAFSLSLKNLLSKRRRTIMVSFAGSIGIIGVSMVLAISAGVQAYIASMQDDMLSGNPIAITQTAIDYSSLMSLSTAENVDVDITRLKDKVYVNSLLETLGTFSQGFSTTNNISHAYVNYVENTPEQYYNVIKYDYGFDVANNIYTDFTVDANWDNALNQRTMSVAAIRGMYYNILANQEDYKSFANTISTVATFDELPDNYNYVLSQYDIVAAYSDGQIVTDASTLTDEQLSAIFDDKSSLIMVLDKNTVADLMLGQFGYITQKEFLNYAFYAVDSDLYDEEVGLVGSGSGEDGGFELSKFIGPDAKTFTWYPNDEVYYKVSDYVADADGEYEAKAYTEGNFTLSDTNGDRVPERIDTDDIDTQCENKVDLSVNIILQKKDGVSYGCLESGFYHTRALTDYVRADSLASGIVEYINSTENGYLDSLPYYFSYINFKDDDHDNVIDDYLSSATIGMYYIYNSGNIMDMIMSGLAGTGSGTDKSAEFRIEAEYLGGSELPVAIYIYPVNFDAKNGVTDYLDAWNDMCKSGEQYVYTDTDGAEHAVTLTEADRITYTDNVGLIIGMINTMIDMITIALVAFTALSLVVSTVMIGIITYVSVVERVKEIGILRAVGARKKDIKRLFNAETFIIGLVAGAIGILITYLLSLVVNVIVMSLAGIWGIAALPWWQAFIMILLSIALTLISGLIPASAAAKKDPVVALRTE